MPALRPMVLGGLLCVAMTPLAFSGAAQAGEIAKSSPITDAFLANVRPNIDFLDRSSRLAASRSRDGLVRDFARAERADAVRSAELLNGVAPPARDTALASADSAALMTGRSVAIDGPTSGPGQSANGRRPLGDADLAVLGKLDGRKFDDAFWVAQVDALSQLRADYQAYVDDGDDAVLAAMAKRELANVEARLVALSRI